MFLGQSTVEGGPTAPMLPSEPSGTADNAVLHRQNNQPGPFNPSADNFPADDPRAGNPQEERSHHVFYAVELLIFALIGWGWLAVREYLGKTPVMDAVVVISVMVCTVVNFVLALIIPSRMEFSPCAHALFTHCVALWILYIYSLSESMRSDSGSLCCVDGSGNRGNSYSAGPAHAAAFFGGLPMHQVPGVVSVAYLSVFLLIAGAQARACTPQPKDWVVRGLGLSIASMIAMHLAVYLIGVPICDKDEAWGVITVLVATVAAFLIIDFDWVMGIVFVFLFRSERNVQQRRDHSLIRSAIQTVGVWFILFFCFVIVLVVENSLSVPLSIVIGACLLVSALGLGYDTVTLYGSYALGIKAWEPETEYTGRTLGARMRQRVHVPSNITRSRSVDSRGVVSLQEPFLRRYPIFLQGQLNRGKKSY